MVNFGSHHISLEYLREQTLGYCHKFVSPFGERFMTYADYIASGRNLRFIEHYLLRIQEMYANTHTEDDITGKSTTELLHKAEESIKRAVNGNEDTRIISAGSGATGAVNKLQEILGVYIPPATRLLFDASADAFADNLKEVKHERVSQFLSDLRVHIQLTRPVVFIGPYEHHSNEVTWRECHAEVVRIALAKDGGIDLDDLERAVSDPAYDGRMKIGSFSAASNVTGMITPVYEVARILHRHGGLVCFDYAASAPYLEIDINRDEESYFDAIFFSPHKFLGGPGSNGLLIFRRQIYNPHLPPTCGGGGTVDYVSPEAHDFVEDIEEREKAGTPGTLQTIKAAAAIAVKEAIGLETISRLEREHLRRSMTRFNSHPGIIVLGNPDPERRISVISFNIRHGGKILHPKFVTRLINDLFGIQSRAGCSCAGPYGHALLDIDLDKSADYRKQVLEGFSGMKPGWVRIGLHFTLTEEDVDFICDAVEFIAEYGHLFLPLYEMDLHSGTWRYIDEGSHEPLTFDIEHVLRASRCYNDEGSDCKPWLEYSRYLEKARELAEKLASEEHHYVTLTPDQEKLRFFEVINLRQ
jgi:selenocysteine lyase/cysteine desulfurase